LLRFRNTDFYFEKAGRIHKMARGIAGGKVRKTREAESESDSDPEREVFSKNWGKASEDFYGGGEDEIASGDEEDAEYQEKEVKIFQKNAVLFSY